MRLCKNHHFHLLVGKTKTLLRATGAPAAADARQEQLLVYDPEGLFDLSSGNIIQSKPSSWIPSQIEVHHTCTRALGCCHFAGLPFLRASRFQVHSKNRRCARVFASAGKSRADTEPGLLLEALIAEYRDLRVGNRGDPSHGSKSGARAGDLDLVLET